MTIPIIDLGRSFGGDPRARRAVAAEIGQACSTIGFLMVTGHGVNQDLIDTLDSKAREFFALPVDEKMKIAIGTGRYRRGYRCVGETNVAATLGQHRPHDLREQFITGPEAVPGDAYYTKAGADRFFHPNVWPERPADLLAAWSAYYAALSDLATHLMRLCALALDLPESYFNDKIDRHTSNLTLATYPEQAIAPQPGQLRAGAHTDFGSLTLLATDGTLGGLQVMMPNGAWRDVMPVKGAFIVNLGDLMAQWTNDRWRSTLHRVVNPPAEVAAASRRQSLVFFHQPNFDALVECLPTCLRPGQRAKYAPITSGDHYIKQVAKITLVKKASEALPV